PYFSHIPMYHAPDDRNIGWFLGRTKLVLSDRCMIGSVEAHTQSLLPDSAIQAHTIQVRYDHRNYFKGSLVINYYPWFPTEGDAVATHKYPIEVRPRIINTFNLDLGITSPNLWSGGNPNLYKVEVLLLVSLDRPVDAYVFTTGIRTIEQRAGELLINGVPEVLNGVQIMSFRLPLETMAQYHRRAPKATIVEEMLQSRKMGANMLRIHVHAEKDTVDGINDPRFAELADQLGMYLIWSTAAFIREGEAWNVDFDGYPEYMAQVYNHPSIVIWEASNHPNKFELHDASDTHDYVSRVYQIIHGKDTSRLISPTSFWQHTHYANH